MDNQEEQKKVRKKHYIKQILSVCYIIFIAAINVGGFRDDLKIQGYPFWMLILCVAVNISGFTSMILWAFEFEPKKRWLWKIVPLALAVYYAAAWYFDFIVYRPPDMPDKAVGPVTFIGLLVLYPLFYSTIKFASRQKKLDDEDKIISCTKN
jgi:hypothetical protein